MARLAQEPLPRPGEVTITPWSDQSIGVALVTCGLVNPVSNNYIAVNRAVFIPFGVPEAITITKLFWGNGSAVAGNIDAGIYDGAGNRLISTGTTAQANTSRLQIVDVTDTTIARGLYYMALASDTSGATQKVVALLPSAGILQSLGLLQAESAFALPNPVTFAKYASAFLPMVGMQGYRAVGP